MALFKHQTDDGTDHTSAPVDTAPSLLPPVGGKSGPSSSSTAAPPAPERDPQLVVPKTRTSATYTGVAVGLAILVLVIIFIAQNLHSASVHFLTFHFKMPLGLLTLAAAVAGAIIVLLVSAARVAQLRLMARRHRSGKPTS